MYAGEGKLPRCISIFANYCLDHLSVSLSFFKSLHSVNAKLTPTCRVFSDLITRTLIRIYGIVMQQSLFIKRLKCTRAYGGWSIFTKKCTPNVTFIPIRNTFKSKCIFLLKMKRPILRVSRLSIVPIISASCNMTL